MRRRAIRIFGHSGMPEAFLAEDMAEEERRIRHAHRAQAGKEPALRPGLSSSASNLANTVRGVKKRRVSRRPPPHGMTTRSKAQAFRILDLPPELRAGILQHAFATGRPMPLGEVALPPLLSVNRQVESEAFPLFFEASTWIVRVRSNWCMRRAHYHTPGYVRYEQTDIITTDHRLAQLPEDAVRFRNILFDVNCVCCHHGVWLMDVRMTVETGRVVFSKEYGRVSDIEGAENALQGMIDDAEAVTAEMVKRQGFNGLTVADLEAVARCFRVEVEGLDGDEF